MSRMFFVRLVAFIIIAFASFYASSEKITIATGEFHPLYSSKNGGRGPVLQVVREAFKLASIDVGYLFLPWPRAEAYGKYGKTDASCCWFFQRERAEKALYSIEVYPYTYSFFHLKTTDFDWEYIQDLQSYRIGATTSYTYTPEFTQAEKSGKINVARINNDLSNLRKLLDRRIDIFPMNTDVGNYLLETELSKDHDVSLVTVHPKPLVESHVSLLFPRGVEGSKRLQKLFNQGLVDLRASGRYYEILNEYKEASID